MEPKGQGREEGIKTQYSVFGKVEIGLEGLLWIVWWQYTKRYTLN